MNLLALPVFALMGIVFHELFVRMRVMVDIRRVLQVVPAAVRVIRSDTLSDLEKEHTVRRMSLDVLRDTARFTVKLALVLGACLAIAALAQALFGVSPNGLEGLLTSWWALAALLVVMPVYARLRTHGPQPARIIDTAVERSGDTRSDGNAVPAAERSDDHRPDELAVPVAERSKDHRPDDGALHAAGQSDDRRPDDSASPAAGRSGDRRPEDDALPVAGRSGDRQPDDGVLPAAGRSSDRRPDDSALPAAERSGDSKPDDRVVSAHHPSPGPEDRPASPSTIERTERAHPAPEHG